MQLVRKVNTVEADGGTMSTFLVGTFPLTLQLLWSKVSGAAGRLLGKLDPTRDWQSSFIYPSEVPCAPTSTSTAPSLTPPLHHIPTAQDSTINNLRAHWEKTRQRQSVPNPWLCWEILTGKGIKNSPSVALTLLILLISAAQCVTKCCMNHTYSTRHSAGLDTSAKSNCSFLTASPKAWLTQDGNERLPGHHQSHCTQRKPKIQTTRSTQRNEIQEALWFAWLWS